MESCEAENKVLLIFIIFIAMVALIYAAVSVLGFVLAISSGDPWSRIVFSIFERF